MKYPDYESYKLLYARYFERSVGHFLFKIDLKNKSVLDLCCGSGRVSEYAITNGAIILHALDNSLDMVPMTIRNNPNIEFMWTTVEDFFKSNLSFKYDVIVCQQAVNYWFNNVSAKSIANCLNSNGVFVFNTFNKIPSTKPVVKEYVLNDKAYCEVSYLIGNEVLHMQSVEGMTMHTTKFDWISPEKFEVELTPHFNCMVIEDKNTSLWYCYKKS